MGGTLYIPSTYTLSFGWDYDVLCPYLLYTNASMVRSDSEWGVVSKQTLDVSSGTLDFICDTSYYVSYTAKRSYRMTEKS